MRVAYVLYGELLAPVVASQTFPLLRGLRERGHEVLLAAITSPRRFVARRRYAGALAGAREAAGGSLRLITHPPRQLCRGWVVRRLRRVLGAFGADVTHCRQSRAAVVAGRAGARGLVADLRGIRPEEYLLALGRSEGDLTPAEARRLSRLREEDREARERAKGIVCVSEAFREHLGAGPEISVIPNAGETVPRPGSSERADLRRSFGLAEGDVAFVYSGSLAPWQCAREAVRLFAEVRKSLPSSRITLLVHDADAGRRLLASEEIADGCVRSLKPAETRAALPAFDFAFLLRVGSVVNRVAAPVKFAEYLHAGLPVILTEGIGDTSAWVEEQGLGIVLPSPGAVGNAGRVMAGIELLDQDRCRAFARERLTFDVTVLLYEEAYRRAAARGEG